MTNPLVVFEDVDRLSDQNTSVVSTGVAPGLQKRFKVAL